MKVILKKNQLNSVTTFIKNNRTRYKEKKDLVDACVKALKVKPSSVLRRLEHLAYVKRGYKPLDKETIRKYLEKNINNYKNDEDLIKSCMEKLHMKRESVDARLREVKRNSNVTSEVKIGVGIGIDDFKFKHDNITRMRTVVLQLKPGKLFPENDFINYVVKISRPAFKTISDKDEFNIYKGRVSNKYFYWGHPEDIKRMKSDGIMT